MSKIARNPVPVPGGVTVQLAGQTLKAKGAKGELSMVVNDRVSVALEDGGKLVKLAPKTAEQESKVLWGTNWALVRNMLKGVHEGYKKTLDIQGVGLRANVQGKTLVLQLGFSHDIKYAIPEGIQITVDKQTAISITGIDKRLVGQVAAEIRGFKPPEPYKGKGIRYTGEYVLQKEGKKK